MMKVVKITDLLGKSPKKDENILKSVCEGYYKVDGGHLIIPEEKHIEFPKLPTKTEMKNLFKNLYEIPRDIGVSSLYYFDRLPKKILYNFNRLPINILNLSFDSLKNYISTYKGTISALISLLLLSTTTSGCIFEDKNKDSDNDGIEDYLEKEKYHTDPNNKDTDGDGLSDYYEIIQDGKSDPLKYDTSGDGIDDKTIRKDFLLNPRKKYPALAYALKKLPKEIVKNSLYSLRNADELSPNMKNLIDILAQYPGQLEDIVNKKWFKNMISDAIITNDEIWIMYDFDGDGIENQYDKNMLNPDRDGDGLLDGKNIVLLGGKDPDLCEELMKEKIFYKENTDGSITFFGEEDIGTDPDKYDTDNDNKGDGFEEFISKTDPLIKNETYVLAMFTRHYDNKIMPAYKYNPEYLKKALERYGIPSQNIYSYLYPQGTFKNYQESIEKLSKIVTNEDYLYVFLDGEGYYDNTFKFDDEWVDNIKIIEEILDSNIKAKAIFVSLNSCYSGMLISELKKTKINLPLVVYTNGPARNTTSIHDLIYNSGISYNYDDIDVFSFLDKKYFNNMLNSRSNPAYKADIEELLNNFKQADKNNDYYVSLEEAFKAYCEEKKILEKNPEYNLDNLSYDPKNLGEILFLGDIYNPDFIK